MIPKNQNEINNNHEEYQYLDLVQKILDSGDYRLDRTKVGTLSIFGTMQRYSLKNNTLPLITTKRTFIRGVIEELLWFISGSTDAQVLAAKGVHIWDANGSRSYLDQLGLTHRNEGDLGPVYGFQWRHSGAKYIDANTDYTGQGIDQLRNIINLIKNSPSDRRILMCSWNPPDVSQMALPPCHLLAQFHVTNGKLSCLVYLRAGDMGLGVPFNIATYALLTHMIAHITGLEAEELIYTIGDTHVYVNHIEALKFQLKRDPTPFPTLNFARKIDCIDDFKYEDFIIKGYEPHPTIHMPMALNSPSDRRMLMCSWNPPDVSQMALPPCHLLAQFHVTNGKLSCLVYLRAGDMGLGVPFNIATYALLTHMIAHITGLEAEELIYTIGDTHVYVNHIEALKFQLKRDPTPFPTLNFARKIDCIDDFKYEDFIIKGYEPHPTIHMPMAL